MNNRRIRHHALTLSLITIIGLGTGTADSADAATSNASESLPASTVIQSLSGEITSRSPVNANNGSRYQRLNVNLTAGKIVRFNLSGALDGTMMLQDSKGAVLGSSFGSRNQYELIQEIPQSGRYVLNVSGKDANSFGPFNVEITYLDIRNSGELSVGDEITGSLIPPDGFNAYTVNIAEEGRYQFDMKSTDFDTYLQLTGEGIDISNDDGGERLNARLMAYLPPGTYRLLAKNVDDDPSGTYTLQMISRPLPSDISLQNGGNLRPGTQINGLHSGQPLMYTLTVPQHSLGIFNMRSEEIDSVLSIEGPGTRLQDDDGGDGNNAQISATLKPGTYTVTAGSYEGNGSGLFTLETTLREILPGSPRTILPGQAADARLSAGGGTNTIELRIAEAGDYVIDMISNDFDTILSIQGQDTSAQDDDGGSGTNSRLSLPLEPGRYQLQAKSYESNESGQYTLTVSHRNESL